MDWQDYASPRSRRRRELTIALAAGVLLGACVNAYAIDALLAGDLTNAATGQPVVGATLTVRFEDERWQVASDEQGHFSATIDLPGEQRLHIVQVSAEHPRFAAKTLEVAIVDGVPEDPITRLHLFPAALAECLLKKDNLVVVGHFRSPLGEDIPDLPDRLAEALQFDLLTVMQQLHLPPALQPVFAPCRDAKPRVITQAGTLARALRAHAVVHGDVSRSTGEFLVRSHVSDAYDIVSVPVTTQNPAVDLANPSAAQLNPQTYGAVLMAVAAGIASRRDCPGALTVIAAAEALGEDVSALTALMEGNCGMNP
ncbi:MAG: carboxypeptidase-like regulatory domain-containing protein [Pseudomonadota bacterium]